MAKRKGETQRYQAAEAERVLGTLSDAVRDGDTADWSAASQYDWGRLVACLTACDAGVMLRSSEQGQAVAVGAFLGGGKQWVTCRSQQELLSVLEAFQTALEALIGARTAPPPASTTRRAPKAP